MKRVEAHKILPRRAPGKLRSSFYAPRNSPRNPGRSCFQERFANEVLRIDTRRLEALVHVAGLNEPGRESRPYTPKTPNKT